LVILDPDRHHGGADGVASFAELVKQNPDCAVEHPVTLTAGGGEHHAFRQPPGQKYLGNKTGDLPPGIDVRGTGGLCVGPGSMRPDGKMWETAEGTPSLAEAFKAGTIPALPQSLLRLIRTPKANGHDIESPPPQRAAQPTASPRAVEGAQSPQPTSGMRGRAYAAKALKEIAAGLSKQRSGTRNEALNKAAFRMATMAANGWAEKPEIVRTLSRACLENGLVADDGKATVHATLASGYDAGFKQPHSPLTEREAGDDDKAIGELTKLSDIEYGRRRKETAEELGITVGILDKVVRDRRKEDRSCDELSHWKVEPAKTAVDTAELLDAIARIFRRHIVLPKHADVAIALWILHSWTFDAGDISPFLALKSPTKRCGKTSVLILLYWLAHRTELASNISPSAIFRYIESQRPTLLIDECETFINSSEETRGILNSGHTKTAAHVIRTVEAGGEHTSKRFSTWAPKALAHIKDLPDTLEDRSITVLMQRKPKGSSVERLLRKDTGEYADVRQLAARWAEDNLERLRDAKPKLPAALNDRAADNWEPLFAVADLAGEEWARMARAAALALSGEDTVADEDIGIQLLHDIKTVFETRNQTALFTKELITELTADEERPWATYGKGDKPITGKQLAKLLKPFVIISGDVHKTDGTHAKGYNKAYFSEAWDRYPRPPKGVPEDPPSEACKHAKSINTGVSDDFSSVRKDNPHGYEKSKKPNNDAGSHACTAKKVESASEDEFGTVSEHLVCSQCGADDDTESQPLVDRGDGLVLHEICAEVWFREHPPVAG
jgi:hypothetical protein